MLGCVGTHFHEIAIEDDELEACKWCDRNEIRQMVAGTHPEGHMIPPSISIAYELITGWLERNNSMTWCVYLTHPEVIIDKDVPMPEWGLSDLGRERAAKAAALPFAKDIKRVVSSGEVKAIETAQAFSNPFGLKPGCPQGAA